MGRQTGFSLIEMIVVLVIIGMLAGLVISNVGQKADKAKWDGAKAQLTSIQNNIEMFRLDVGRLPNSLNDLAEKPADAEFWTGYAKASQLKDPWKRDWVYNKQASGGQEYELMTYGKDGSPGGEGSSSDISVWD